MMNVAEPPSPPKKTVTWICLLKLVLPATDGFLPSPLRPMELMSPVLPDCMLFFGTDKPPPPRIVFTSFGIS
jgi:hypothetical protein